MTILHILSYKIKEESTFKIYVSAIACVYSGLSK